jgi:tRNA pseudouridine38-40 synthase
MPRYRATLAYDGTAYQGYQIQPGVPTIQGTLEDVLRQIAGVPISVMGAGRTDAGVHATGQVIAFDLDWQHSDDALLKALNAFLPPDMAIQAVRQQPGFHPRFAAVSRMYRYDVLESAIRQPLYHQRAWYQPQGLHRAAMRAAAHLLIGEHDFATFGTPPRGENTVRVVYRSDWAEYPIAGGTLHSYTIEATAFLQHMVRRIVALLVAVGRGMWSVDQFEAAFREANLKRAKPPAPPHGLYLVQVKYAE